VVEEVVEVEDEEDVVIVDEVVEEVEDEEVEDVVVIEVVVVEVVEVEVICGIKPVLTTPVGVTYVTFI
jgi:hypothetical protein